jgi:predicted RNA-binding protein with PIN domain
MTSLADLVIARDRLQEEMRGCESRIATHVAWYFQAITEHEHEYKLEMIKIPFTEMDQLTIREYQRLSAELNLIRNEIQAQVNLIGSDLYHNSREMTGSG